MSLAINIIALILALPLQMASFSRAMVHLIEHQPIAREIAHHEHDLHDGEHEDDHESTSENSEAEHSHGDGSPIHSHAKDFSDVLVVANISRNEVCISLRSCSHQTIATFQDDHFRGRRAYLLVFRPPIAA